MVGIEAIVGSVVCREEAIGSVGDMFGRIIVVESI